MDELTNQGWIGLHEAIVVVFKESLKIRSVMTGSFKSYLYVFRSSKGLQKRQKRIETIKVIVKNKVSDYNIT